MNKLLLPVEVEAVFQEFYTCELSTYSKNGYPTTWPTLPSYLAERGRFIILTSVGLPQKVYNIRRNPRVSILFSNPTGSGLARPPAVLVQGDARVSDQVFARLDQFEPEIRAAMGALGARMIQRQPSMKRYFSSPLTRFLMGWYFIRLMITITPRRISWWPEGDFSHPPRTLEPGQTEASHVE